MEQSPPIARSAEELNLNGMNKKSVIRLMDRMNMWDKHKIYSHYLSTQLYLKHLLVGVNRLSGVRLNMLEGNTPKEYIDKYIDEDTDKVYKAMMELSKYKRATEVDGNNIRYKTAENEKWKPVRPVCYKYLNKDENNK